MTKIKKLEERIAQLEKLVMELQSQLLTISLQRSIPVLPLTPLTPSPEPNIAPRYPYIGDRPWAPTTTWISTTGSNLV
jgi:hypothetical protein